MHVEQESSLALGFGFRCGFLGLLHLEITFERLQREFDLDIITTAPSVVYKVTLSNGEEKKIDNPAHYPNPAIIEFVEEPWVVSHIMTPSDFLGPIMALGTEKRGILDKTESMGGNRLLLTFRFPMNEIITDFNDKLKSVTRGYGSFNYEFDRYDVGSVIKLEIKVNDEVVDAFSCLVHTTKAEAKGRAICKKLRDVIPRQQFKVPIQAAIGGKIIARETLSALSKECDRQVLRWGHYQKTQTLGKTKERKEKNERDW